MKRILSIVVLFFTITTVSIAQNSYSTIIVDEAHNNIAPNADKENRYSVKSGKGLNVDATKMDFEILKKYNNGNMPDKIFLRNEEGSYIADFNAEKIIILDKNSLKPYTGNTPFMGFKKNDTPIISIGTLKLAGKAMKMAQVWSNMLIVE